MWICESCEKIFDEPDTIRGYIPPDDDMVCPFCDSPYIDDAEECAICGEVVPTVKLCIHGDNVCEACMTRIMDKAKGAMKKALCADEYKAISDYLDLDAQIV